PATSGSSGSSACGGMPSSSRSAAAPSRRTRRTSRATWRASPRFHEPTAATFAALALPAAARRSPDPPNATPSLPLSTRDAVSGRALTSRRRRERAVLVHLAVRAHHHRAAAEGALVGAVLTQQDGPGGREDGAGNDRARAGAERRTRRAGRDVDAHALGHEPPHRTDLRLGTEPDVLRHPDAAVVHADQARRRREPDGAHLVRAAVELQEGSPSNPDRAIRTLDERSRRRARLHHHVGDAGRDGGGHQQRRVDHGNGQLETSRDRGATDRRTADYAGTEPGARDDLAEE